MTENTTFNKLLILYLLDRIQVPISGTSLLEFASEKQYMDYLSLSETLSELIDSDMISSDKQANRIEYVITSEGSRTIGFLEERLPDDLKKEIRSYIRKHYPTLRDENSVSANYHRTASGDYIVECRITEDRNTVLSLDFSVPTEVQAQRSSIKWKEQAQSVYAYLMGELL